MKSISVDRKGLAFSVTFITAIILIVALYLMWVPIHQSVMSGMKEDESKLLASAARTEREVIETDALATYMESLPMFVYINVEKKQIELIEDTQTVAQFDIVRLPKQHSSESVPAGTYTVDKKSLVQPSTITMIRFPFYIVFGDRYALHAKPTDANGVELTEVFPGSKIELRTEDAKRIYEFVSKGTPIVVSVSSGFQEPITPAQQASLNYTDLPATSARSYLLGDLKTGEVYLSKQADERYPIASITKLTTAAVATDIIGHGEVLQTADGEHYTLSDLYYPLLLRSDNAVARSIALHAGEKFFLSNMNAYVRALGMNRSSFGDTSGLSPRNISTANDLFIFADHIYKKKYFLFDITHEETMTITSTEGNAWSMKNQNQLASDPHFQGGKLGYTDEAAQTSLAVFSVPVGTETRPIAVVILQSEDWKQDTRTLLRWLVEQAK